MHFILIFKFVIGLEKPYFDVCACNKFLRIRVKKQQCRSF